MQKINQEKEKRIRENIEKRYNIIVKAQKRMLNSILEKPWKKIIIDKVIVEKEKERGALDLITDPDKVKREIDTYYKDQFRRRAHQFENISSDWEQEYKPKDWIEEEWYSSVLRPINIEE